jgi:hypothetical protein
LKRVKAHIYGSLIKNPGAEFKPKIGHPDQCDGGLEQGSKEKSVDFLSKQAGGPSVKYGIKFAG